MSEADGDFLKLYEVMSDRITDLSKSYHILNDSHHNVELELAKVNTKIDTTVSIVKWFISPIALVSLIIQILSVFKVIG